jgi:hypothetical protein
MSGINNMNKGAVGFYISGMTRHFRNARES